MPYNKRFQDEKKDFQKELEDRVDKGEITKKQADSLYTAWDRDRVRFNECGNHPNRIIKGNPYSKKFTMIG